MNRTILWYHQNASVQLEQKFGKFLLFVQKRLIKSERAQYTPMECWEGKTHRETKTTAKTQTSIYTITTNAGFSETISPDHFIHFPSSTRHAYGESTQKINVKRAVLHSPFSFILSTTIFIDFFSYYYRPLYFWLIPSLGWNSACAIPFFRPTCI